MNEKVLAMVRREVEKNPAVTNDTLLNKAVAIDRSVRKLSRQQFHGTYRLTAARALAPNRRRRRTARTGSKGPSGDGATKGRERSPAPSGSAPQAADADRAAVRATLLEFAGEIARAESKADIIAVLSSVDRYVERVVAAAALGQSRA
jgi:hypothetical protein